MLLEEWFSSKPNLTREELDKVDRLSYLDGFTSSGGRILKVSLRINETRLALIILETHNNVDYRSNVGYTQKQ